VLGFRLKFASAELTNKCRPDVGIGIRAGICARDEYCIGVVARSKADIGAGGRCAASIIRMRHRRMRRGDAAVTASRHRCRRRYGDRDGKRQREHQADHGGTTISSEFDAE
jgi:hypothetical protein